MTLINGFLHLGGDEPRYLYYSISFFKGQFLTLPDYAWKEFLEAWGMPYMNSGHGILTSGYSMSDMKAVGGILPSILASFATGVGGPIGARIFSCFVGLTGVWFLVLNLERFFKKWIVWTAVLIILVSEPFLTHAVLLNLDIYMFAFICIALFYLFEPNPDQLSPCIIPLVICALPLMHTRACYIAAWLMLVFYFRIWRQGSKSAWRPALICSLIGFIIFTLVQWYMYGSLDKLRELTYKIDANTIPTRLLLEWVQSRHGLFSNAPIMFIGLLGLIYGSIKRNWLCSIGLVIFCFYSGTIIIQDAAESYPARLWVPILPFFVIGACAFLDRCRQEAFLKQSGWIIFIFNMLINLGLLSLMFVNVGYFMLNRRSSFSFDWLYHQIPIFHFGLFLPVKLYLDEFNFSQVNSFRALLIVGLLTTVGIGWLLSVLTSKKTFKTVGYIASFFGLFLIFDLSRVDSVKLSSEQCIEKNNEDGLKSQIINFNQNGSIISVGLTSPASDNMAGYSPDYPNYLNWQATDISGNIKQGTSKYLPTLAPSDFGYITSLQLTELEPSKASWNQNCYEVFMDRSLVRALIRSF